MKQSSRNTVTRRLSSTIKRKPLKHKWLRKERKKVDLIKIKETIEMVREGMTIVKQQKKMPRKWVSISLREDLQDFKTRRRKEKLLSRKIMIRI